MTPAELARLFVSETPRLIRRLARFRGRVAAEDVVQSAFSKLLEQDMAGIEDPKAYLARLVRNLAVDEVRRQERARTDALSEQEMAEILAVRPGPYDRLDLTPEEMLIAGERFAHMTAMVLALPRKERLALLLHKAARLSHKEIGVRLGVSAKSVPRYIARALVKCARARQAFEEGPLKEIANGLGTKSAD